MKKDENGNETSDIDWEKTKAVAVRTSYIWINLKGRDEFGIVEPEDKYAVEEQIIDDLYRYRNANGDRIIAMASTTRMQRCSALTAHIPATLFT